MSEKSFFGKVESILKSGKTRKQPLFSKIQRKPGNTRGKKLSSKSIRDLGSFREPFLGNLML